MGKTKRILSFFIALIMVLALVPFNAIVYAVEEASGTEAQKQSKGSANASTTVSSADELIAAVDAAQAGDTIKVTADIADLDVTVTKDITLDLGGKTITDAYIQIAAKVTIKNGSIKNVNEPYPLVVNSGSLTVEKVNIEASASDRAIWLRNSGAVLNFNSGSILATKGENNTKAKIYGVLVSSGTTANINGGTITVDAGPSATAVAIFGNYVNTVNINGGKISTSGTTYSYAVWTDGDVTVTGGEIVTNEKQYGYSSGITYGKNYAINTKGDVEISGGKITTNGPSGYLVNAGGSDQKVTISNVKFECVLSEADKTQGGHSEPKLIYGSSVTTTITGGSFEGVNEQVMEFIEVGATVTVAGTTYTKAEDGSFSEVEPKPELPTATVAPIVNNSNVLFGLTFSADSVTAEQLEAYGDYFADFVITFNKDLTLGCGEGTDGWLSGNYGDYGWINVPTDGKTISVKANESYRVMDIAAELLGKDSLHITYDFVVKTVQEFQCGVYLTPEFVAENPDFKVGIGLSMFEPVEDENGNTVLGEEIKVECTDANGAPMQTTFTSKDISLELPSAKVYPVINTDLSFGLTFEVNKITDAQLDYYGDWYADFTIEFSVPGSDLTEIVLGTGEGADGWLSGQYDEWSENWVNVPFENKSIPLNEPIKVMDFAAKIMGKDGLKVTYNDVYTAVKKFNCGVYLTPEFIAENGNFTVAVDLAMFEPTVDENGNAIEKEHTVVYTDENGKVIDKADVTLFDKDDVYVAAVAQIGDTKYATLGEAMAALKDGDTLTLLADINGATVQFIEFNGKKNITITAAQGVVINGSIQVGYHVSHTDSGVDRSESTFTVDGLTVTGTLTVNSNDKNVVVKNCAAAQITVKTYTMNGMNITIDKNVADGSMGTAAKNYGMYLVPNATDYKLVVSNNTFKNINSHAFAVQGYGDGAAVTAANSIAITGNTFESWGLDGSSNRAAFKIWADTKYAPEASDLNNTTIAMRELVATTAASGNNTYLSTASNTVEYDAFGAAGDAEDFPDPVYVTYVAQVGEQKFESVIGAINYAVENGITEVKLLESVRELMPTDVEIVIKNDLTITADAPVEVKFYNNGTKYDFVIDCEGYGDYDFTIGENVTFVLEDRVIWVGYYGSNIDVVVDGTLSGNQIWAGGDIYVNETGTLNSTGEAFVIRRGKTVFVDGGKVNANYFNILAGNIKAENGAVIESGALWIDNKGGYAGEGAVSITLWDSTLTVKGNLKSASDKFVNIDVYNSIVEITDVHGYGASVLDANTTLYVDGESGKLTIYKGLNNNGVVDVYDGGELIIANNATVTNNGSIYIDSISTISGPANMGVETEVANMEVEYVDGKYILVEKISYVAYINGVGYATLEAAIAAAQAGDEVILLADVAEDVTVPAGVIFNGNGKQVGVITAAGEITFKGHTKTTNFGVQYTNTTINIIEGACLELTGTGRMVIGHGCTFNITGTITDAKTADKANITPSLIAAGASFTGAGVNFNVTNAYVKFTAYCSSKNSSANGTFNFDVENSIWEQTGSFVFSEPTSGKDPTFNLTLKNSVLDSTSHLVFAVAKGEIVFDNSNVNVGASRQIENRSTLTIKNGSVVNGAVATSSNAKNPGTIIVENATYAVTGEFTGSDVGTGTLVIKKGANITIGKITKANIVIDATDMVAGEIANFTANLSAFAGELSVINNDKLEAKIVDGKIVLSAKPVAKIGDNKYETLEEAIAAAKNGDEVVILVAGTYTVPSGKDITITGAVDGVVFDNIKKHAMGGASVTFNNVTFNYSMTEGHNGLQHSGDLVYNKCTFNGQVFLYGTRETFNNCTFNQTDVDNYNVWTYAADDVKFNGCTFYSKGRSLLIYSEGTDLYANVVITDCDFISSNAVDGKAAIEMDSSLSAGIKVTIDAATTATGFGSGNVSGNSLWNNKKGNETAANNDITVVVNGVTVLAPVTYVAQIGNKKYTSLQDAIDAAQAGDVIVVLEDIELDTTIVVAAGKELTIDLNGKTISYTSTVQGEAMITNKGNLTINDSAETGVINYNYVGAADSTYGKGNYTISNAGTLTVNGGEITIAKLSGHAKYPIDNNSTTGDAILVINGGHLYNYNTSAIRMFCNSTTYKNSVTINGGLIEGYCAIWVQNPGSKTVNANLTIAGGEIKTTAKAYVNGTAALDEVSSSIYFTISGNGGAWSADSSVAITGGTINENVDLKNTAPEAYTVEGTAKFNGRLVLPMVPVATVNGVEYGSLQDAINAANGATIVLIADIELTDGVVIPYGYTVVLELNGKTISQTKAQTGNYSMITNDGILTIQDTVGGGKISYTDTVGGNFVSNTIMNRGTLTLKSGRIENMSSQAVANAGYPYAIDTSIWGAANEVVTNIEGGVVYCASYSAIRLRADSETEAVNVTISGGEIYGRIEVQNPQSKTASAGKLTITDGIINKNNSSMAIMIFGGGAAATNMKMEITGGEFVGAIGYSTYFPITGFDEKAISGGTFDTDVSAFCADGYVCVAKGVGTYGVVEAPKYNITIAGKTLSLDAAIQVNLYFAKASFAGADEIYAVVQVGTKEAYVIKYGEDGWAVGQDGYAYDALNIKGIAAKEMGDVIRVQFYVGNPDDEVADVKASNEITYSVKEYAYTVIGRDNQPLEAKQSMYALLKYGAAAQKYFKYNTENLVDADLTEAMDQAYATSDVAVTKTQVFIKGQEYRLGNTMSLDDSPVLNYYFNTFHKDEYREKIYATATYIGWDNQEHVITIKADEIVYDTVKGQTLVAIKGLSGADVSSDITLRVFAENGETLFESVYSIEAYLKAAMGAYVSDVYLYQALANYGATASAYLKKINDIK